MRTTHLELGSIKGKHPASGLFLVLIGTGLSSPEESLVNPREQHLPSLGGHVNPTDGYSAEKCCRKPRAELRIRVAPTELTMEFRLDYKVTPSALEHAQMKHHARLKCRRYLSPPHLSRQFG